MKKYIRILGVLLILGAVSASAVLWMTNIDMTETRLLITYWKECIAISFAAAVGLFLIGYDLKRW